MDRSHRKLAHRGSYEGIVWVSRSSFRRVLVEYGLSLPAPAPRTRSEKRPWPDWLVWQPNRIWIWDATYFTRARRVCLAIVDLVSRKWIDTLVSVEETATQVTVLFEHALELEGLLELLTDERLDLDPDHPRRPILLAVSDNGPPMTAVDLLQEYAALQHAGGLGAEHEVAADDGAERLVGDAASRLVHDFQLGAQNPGFSGLIDGPPRRARVLVRLAGAAGDADLPSPARWYGCRHHLPDDSVLLDRQGPDPAGGRPVASSRPGGSAMFVDLTPEQRALQAELRQYFSSLISPEEAREMQTDRHGKAYRAVIRRMGQDGKLGVGWPREFGGHGFGPIEQQIFINEAARADVPLPAVTLQTVGPTLQKYGSEAQMTKFLPAILAGEVHFAIGYSEPDAGTDLASLRTTAVRQGDEYIVNGQKIFTTGAHDADYIWLACRTDPEAVKHKGISILIVDTKDPGYSWTPIITSDGAHHTNASYYSDVRVPVDMLVGEENAGWRLITTQLNHERVMLGPAGKVAGIYDRVHAWASKPGGNGVTPIDHEDVRRALGEIHSIWRINELLNWQVAAAGETIDVADAAATKVFSTERIQLVGRLAEEMVGKYGNPAESETAELLFWLDQQTKRNLVITFGGGVNEVMREMIAASGLKVPRVPR